MSTNDEDVVAISTSDEDVVILDILSHLLWDVHASERQVVTDAGYLVQRGKVFAAIKGKREPGQSIAHFVIQNISIGVL